MEDGRIIELYWDRDQRAIPETAGKYGRMLHGIAWNLLRSREDAEECVNDTYLRVWEAIPPARPGAFRIWLGQITRISPWTAGRASGRRSGAAARSCCWESWRTAFPRPAAGRNGELEDQELAELLNVFLRGLSREGRAMFLRRYWYGESVAEVALALGCGEGKVKSSLFRSRKALREYLEKEGIAV